jgi:hypothetical protein
MKELSQVEEDMAKEIYQAMQYAAQLPPYGFPDTPKWQVGGNSIVQDRARQTARAIIEMLPMRESGTQDD